MQSNITLPSKETRLGDMLHSQAQAKHATNAAFNFQFVVFFRIALLSVQRVHQQITVYCDTTIVVALQELSFSAPLLLLFQWVQKYAERDHLRPFTCDTCGTRGGASGQRDHTQ